MEKEVLKVFEAQGFHLVLIDDAPDDNFFGLLLDVDQTSRQLAIPAFRTLVGERLLSLKEASHHVEHILDVLVMSLLNNVLKDNESLDLLDIRVEIQLHFFPVLLEVAK